MPYMDLGRIPEDISVEYQDTLPRFEEPGNRRAGEGVRFLKRTEEKMEIVLDPAHATDKAGTLVAGMAIYRM